MKIITNEAVYVQKNDIGFLDQTDLPIPASIYSKLLNNGIIIIDDSNRFEFVKFEEESEIEFFKDQDWIIDFNLLKDLDESKIMELGQEVCEQKNNIAKKYNAMSNDERKSNENLFYECERLDFKMYSLRDFLHFKQGNIQFDLPNGIEFSKEPKNEKRLQKILNKFNKTRKNY